MGCTYELKRLAGTDCVGCTCDRKQFRRIIVFLALLYVFPYLSARRSHTTTFCRTCVPGGHNPDGFWVMWEGTPYHPHSLGDGSKCHHGKGLKAICLGPTRTSAVHSQNDIQLSRLNDYQSGLKSDPLNINFQIRTDQIAFEYGSRGLNQHTFLQKRGRKLVLGNETLRNKRVGSPRVE